MVYLLVVLHLKVHRSQVTSEGDLCGVETNSCLVVTNCLRGTGTFDVHGTGSRPVWLKCSSFSL